MATLQESVTRHQEEQDILSPLVNTIASSVIIARRRLANIELEKVGDIDIHDGEYEPEYDSGLEDRTQSEAGSVFYAAYGRMRRWEEGEAWEQVQEAPKEEGPRQGGGRKGYLVFFCLIFLLVGCYFFNKI